jgi:hypothetical protein
VIRSRTHASFVSSLDSTLLFNSECDGEYCFWYASKTSSEIGRLDVAVDNAGVVDAGESLSRLNRQIHRFANWQSLPVKARLDRFSIVEGHCNEELAVQGFVNLVNRTDVRVVQSGRRLSFQDESLFALAFPDQIRGRNFKATCRLRRRSCAS